MVNGRKVITLLEGLLLCCAFSYAESFVPRDGEIRFKVYQTTPDRPLHEVLSTPFTCHGYSMIDTLNLDEAKVSHEYLGCGASLTDASAWLLSRMSKAKRKAFLKDAFGPDGMNLSVIRLNCGSSDYATELYNYNDVAGDVDMEHFSIDRDKLYYIPVTREIMKLRRDLFLFSSIWSCPGWMKSSGAMCGGSLLPEYEEAFANYWTAYLDAYRREGIHIDAITTQNEPRTDQMGGCPATLMTGEQEARIAGRLLPEKLKNAGLDTKLWIYDHNPNRKHFEYIIPLFSDPDVQRNADAVAWHPYTGSAEMIDTLKAMFPMYRKMHLTERGPSMADADKQTEFWWCRLIFRTLNHGCSSYSSWNLLLDEDGQPNTGRFACAGLETIDSQTGEISRSTQYNVFHQFCPYVSRGAGILAIDQPDPDIICIAFRNPDGSHVVCVASDGLQPDRKRVQIKYKGQYMTLVLPYGSWSMSTIVIDK